MQDRADVSVSQLCREVERGRGVHEQRDGRLGRSADLRNELHLRVREGDGVGIMLFVRPCEVGAHSKDDVVRVFRHCDGGCDAARIL